MGIHIFWGAEYIYGMFCGFLGLAFLYFLYRKDINRAIDRGITWARTSMKQA